MYGIEIDICRSRQRQIRIAMEFHTHTQRQRLTIIFEANTTIHYDSLCVRSEFMCVPLRMNGRIKSVNERKKHAGGWRSSRYLHSHAAVQSSQRACRLISFTNWFFLYCSAGGGTVMATTTTNGRMNESCCSWPVYRPVACVWSLQNTIFQRVCLTSIAMDDQSN